MIKLFKTAFGPVPYMSQGATFKENIKGHTKRTLACVALMLIVTAIEFMLICAIYVVQKIINA